MIRKATITKKEDVKKVLCFSCRQMVKEAMYRTIFQPREFCSKDCIRKYFNYNEKINYETFRV